VEQTRSPWRYSLVYTSSSGVETAQAVLPISGLSSAGRRKRGQRHMGKPRRSFTWPLILIEALTCFVSCRSRPVAISQPASAVTDARLEELTCRADAQFGASHLHGWRVAEDLYEEAFAISGNETIRSKLVLTRFLRATREIDERIPGSVIDPSIASICSNPENGEQEALCEICRRYRQASQGTVSDQSLRPEVANFPVLIPDQPALDAYLGKLNMKALGPRPSADLRASTLAKFPESPLWLYLNPSDAHVTTAGEIDQRWPGFAELYVYLGERSFRSSRFKEARTCFSKALDLIPDYTRALIDLGNLYLHSLEEYEEAIRWHEKALSWDRSNVPAQFGKGVALQFLGRFADSDYTFDQMLKNDLAHEGDAGPYNILYYRGMARYYMAYSAYRLYRADKARALIDLAKQDLPKGEQINYLSGLLYFNADQFEAARFDFQKSLESGQPNCDAYYYLGRIYLPIDGPRAAEYFLGMCSCVEEASRSLERNIASISTLDMETEAQDRLRERLEKRLVEHKRASAESIRSAIAFVNDSTISLRDTYVKLMEESLALFHE
jgi:tetratricopeptide (TPR) repeat protein